MGYVSGKGKVPVLPPPKDPGPAGSGFSSWPSTFGPTRRCETCGAPGQVGRCHYCRTLPGTRRASPVLDSVITIDEAHAAYGLDAVSARWADRITRATARHEPPPDRARK